MLGWSWFNIYNMLQGDRLGVYFLIYLFWLVVNPAYLVWYFWGGRDERRLAQILRENHGLEK